MERPPEVISDSPVAVPAVRRGRSAVRGAPEELACLARLPTPGTGDDVAAQLGQSRPRRRSRLAQGGGSSSADHGADDGAALVRARHEAGHHLSTSNHPPSPPQPSPQSARSSRPSRRHGPV